MRFEKIQPAQHDLTQSAAFHAGRVRLLAAELSKAINDLLNSEHPVESWGTSCSVGENGITLRISTPFGEARAVAAVQLVGEQIGLRYIFEKLVSSSSGRPIFRPVWAVRISDGGNVVSEDGEVIFSMRSISRLERQNGVAIVALSAIYAIATEEGYYVADDIIS